MLAEATRSFPKFVKDEDGEDLSNGDSDGGGDVDGRETSFFFFVYSLYKRRRF